MAVTNLGIIFCRRPNSGADRHEWNPDQGDYRDSARDVIYAAWTAATPAQGSLW
jgi:hypothetical protein